MEPITKDLIIVQPIHVDYPLFRLFLQKHAKDFNKVIIAFTDMAANLPDLRPFIQENLKDKNIIFTDVLRAESGEDWRHKAITQALSISDASWVFFMEQDFIAQERVWDFIETDMPKADIFYVNTQGRMHPCCLIIKRDVLEQTSKNFAANPPLYDHFGQIQLDLEKNTPPLAWIQIMPHIYKHMNGLSQNMFLLMTGQVPNYEPAKFAEYLKACLNAKVELTPEFREMAKNYVNSQKL